MFLAVAHSRDTPTPPQSTPTHPHAGIMAAVQLLTYLTGTIGLAANLTAAILRTPHTPRKPCVLCAARSANHPAGPLVRYTRRRNPAGQPECRRHIKDGPPHPEWCRTQLKPVDTPKD